MTVTVQSLLSEGPPPETTLQLQWEAFDARNPEVYRRFLKYALRGLRLGRTRLELLLIATGSEASRIMKSSRNCSTIALALTSRGWSARRSRRSLSWSRCFGPGR